MSYQDRIIRSQSTWLHSEVGAGLIDIQNDVDVNSQIIDSILQDTIAIQGELTTINNNVLTNSAVLTTVGTNVLVNSGAIAAVKADTTTIKTDVSTNQTLINSNITKCSRIETQVNENGVGISNTESKVDSVYSKTVYIKSFCDDYLSTHIAGLETGQTGIMELEYGITSTVNSTLALAKTNSQTLDTIEGLVGGGSGLTDKVNSTLSYTSSILEDTRYMVGSFATVNDINGLSNEINNLQGNTDHSLTLPAFVERPEGATTVTVPVKIYNYGTNGGMVNANSVKITVTDSNGNYIKNSDGIDINGLAASNIRTGVYTYPKYIVNSGATIGNEFTEIEIIESGVTKLFGRTLQVADYIPGVTNQVDSILNDTIDIQNTVNGIDTKVDTIGTQTASIVSIKGTVEGIDTKVDSIATLGPVLRNTNSSVSSILADTIDIQNSLGVVGPYIFGTNSTVNSILEDTVTIQSQVSSVLTKINALDAQNGPRTTSVPHRPFAATTGKLNSDDPTYFDTTLGSTQATTMTALYSYVIDDPADTTKTVNNLFFDLSYKAYGEAGFACIKVGNETDTFASADFLVDSFAVTSATSIYNNSGAMKTAKMAELPVKIFFGAKVNNVASTVTMVGNSDTEILATYSV